MPLTDYPTVSPMDGFDAGDGVVIPPLPNNPYGDRPPSASNGADGSPMATAVGALQAAVDRHQRHMDGSEPTTPESQMAMMEEMQAALDALQSMPAPEAMPMPHDPMMAAPRDPMTESRPNHRRFPAATSLIPRSAPSMRGGY
jgi:hypothetical protein